MADTPKILSQPLELWNKLGGQAKVTLGGIVLVVVAFLAVVVGGDHRDYALLFRLSEPKEVGTVIASLDAAKIDHRLRGEGTIIEVPREDVDRARLLLRLMAQRRSGECGHQHGARGQARPGKSRQTHENLWKTNH